MGIALLRVCCLAALVLLLHTPMALAASAAEPLEQRLASWPSWSLPAPLPRPGQGDLLYPEWFEGRWQATNHDPSGIEPDLHYDVRFTLDAQGAVVGDRAFNAAAIGSALLGDQLLQVRNDPLNPNRQLALLAGDQRLESTVVGRRSAQTSDSCFLADELALQVLHGPGDPRVSRVETLSRYRLVKPDRIEAEQWQASYGAPAEGLAAEARHSWRGQLVLERLD
ncbi:DUF6816 family protein [Vulcanococcus sp.]|jgi:hypothetical protein|uniref:DUF6816 family protein n=1 Tax=Vulcanococcus sp. TaxID=2856995 RepID=UPI0037D9E6B1